MKQIIILCGITFLVSCGYKTPLSLPEKEIQPRESSQMITPKSNNKDKAIESDNWFNAKHRPRK